MQHPPKPDDFPFSQEIYEEIEEFKHRLVTITGYKDTPEGIADATRLSEYVLCDRYDQYLARIFAERGIQYTVRKK